jgi:hypothetical protein
MVHVLVINLVVTMESVFTLVSSATSLLIVSTLQMNFAVIFGTQYSLTSLIIIILKDIFVNTTPRKIRENESLIKTMFLEYTVWKRAWLKRFLKSSLKTKFLNYNKEKKPYLLRKTKDENLTSPNDLYDIGENMHAWTSNKHTL